MGIDEDPGSFLLGSQGNADLMAQKISFNEMMDGSYERFKGKKLWGSYGILGSPQMVVNDLELIKDVLIKDFEHFPDQRDFYFGTNKYINEMLISIKGEKWKTMRTMASPVFTSGKLKGMVPLIESVGDEMVKYLDDFATNGKEFECKDLFTMYSVDVVATTGFGVEAQSFANPDGTFLDQVNKMTYRGKYKNAGGMFHDFKMGLGFLWPDMARLLGVEVLDPKAVNFFCDIIKAQLRDRQKTGRRRTDFIDALLQGMDQSDKEGSDGSKIFKSQEEFETAVVANGLVLFFGGFDTSSTTASVLCWFLAKHPEVQETLYEEIRDAIEANDNSEYLDYDTVQTLPYLDGVITESLRLYPLGHLERTCVKEYTFKGTDTPVTIKPGTIVQCPTVAMMRDEKYFEDPLTFNPSRWNKEEAGRNPFLHFTFGHGPRNCIGKRFAMLQNKMAFIRLVANYKLVAYEKTAETLKMDPSGISGDVLGGVWIKCVKRDTDSDSGVADS